MKIVGCDLHAKQQTIAMVDTDTGEFIEKTIPTRGVRYESFTRAYQVHWWSESKPPDRCSGFWNCWES
jgi:hypothetical protein